MTKEDVIEMARECGFVQAGYPSYVVFTNEMLRFASLVAAAEREACAKVCEERDVTGECYVEGSAESRGCAEAIRARSNGV